LKTCKTCGENKPLAQFPQRKDSKDGYRPYCKLCYAGRIKEVRATPKKFKAAPESYTNPTLTTDQKKHVYTAVILRMKNQGLASGKTADEMLARVGGL
jgi:hypothetical protein